MIVDTTVVAYGPGLILTQQHQRQMIGNKSCGYVTMDPRDFLDLTCGSWAQREQIMKDSLSLSEYNEFAIKGENIIPPFLCIETEKQPIGKVTGHEGRHRAAALIKDKILTMPVFLIKKEMGAGIWRVNKYKDNPLKKFEYRFIGPEDFPDFLIGEYSSARVKLDKSTWVGIQ